MKLKRIAALVMCVSMASGCATINQFAGQFGNKKQQKGPTGSYVQIDDWDVEGITRDMASFLADQLPPAKTTLELVSVDSSLHNSLFEQLAFKGFGVVVNNSEGRVVPLRYAITPFDSGVIVRMKYRGTEASRFFPRTSAGGLSFHTAYAVREVTK